MNYNTEKPAQNERAFLDLNPATSYFPTTESCSIIGSSRLNFRVRDGNGCDPTDNITGKLFVSDELSVVSDEFKKLDQSPVGSNGFRIHRSSLTVHNVNP